MNTLQILKDARALITPRGAWLQEDFAKNNIGQYVYGNDPGTVCFCAKGAVQKVTDRIANYDIYSLLSRAAGMDCASYNDTHSHEEVLAMFDRAIMRLAGECEESLK